MAKTSYLTANVTLQDTFAQWLTRHNQITYDMGTVVLTAGAVLEPNTTNGAWTSGNTHLEGIFGATTVAVAGGLRGGSVGGPANLNVVSNTIFSASTIVTIGANTQNFNVNGNNTFITSNVAVTGATKTFTINNSRTSISGGGFYVDAAVANFSGPSFISTSNTSIEASNVYVKSANVNIDATSTFIGGTGANTLRVNSQTTLAANTRIEGVATLTNNVVHTGLNARFDNNVELGSSNTDVVTLRSTVTGDIIPTTHNTHSIGLSGRAIANIYTRQLYASEDVNATRDVILSRNVRHNATSGKAMYEAAVASGVLPAIGFNLRSGANTTNIVNLTKDDLVPGATNSSYNLGSNANRWGDFWAKNADFSGNVIASGIGDFASVHARDIPNEKIPVAGALGKLGYFAPFYYRTNTLFAPNVTASANIAGNDIKALTILTLGATGSERVTLRSDGRGEFANSVTTRLLTTTGATSEQSTISTGLLVEGNTRVRSNLTVEGASSVLTTPALNVSGPTSLVGNTTAGNVRIMLNLDCSGPATFSSAVQMSQLTVQGPITSGHTISSAANTSVGSHLTVGANTNATSTTTGSIVTQGGVGIAKDLFVGGQVDLGANTTIRGNLNVMGSLNLASDISLSLNTSTIRELTVLDKIVMGTDSLLEGHLVPSTNNSYTLGTAANKFSQVHATTFTGALSGNATTAARLQTARTINGVSFNGSANITLTSIPTQVSAVNNVFPLAFYGTTAAAITNNGLDAFKYATSVAVNPSISTIFADHFDITSDIRLKSDVVRIKGALDIVSKLEGVSFIRNSIGKKEYGIIAQEVKKVIPEVINENSDGLLTFDATQMNGFYIECIKELKNEIEQLKRTLNRSS